VFKIKLTTGSGNVGTCEELHDRSQIWLWQKAGVCASTLKAEMILNRWGGENPEVATIKETYREFRILLLYVEHYKQMLLQKYGKCKIRARKPPWTLQELSGWRTSWTSWGQSG